MSAASCLTEWCTPRRISLTVISANHRSTRLSQELAVGVKWMWKRGWASSHFFDGRCLVSGQVVADQVHIQIGGNGLVDGDQKPCETPSPDAGSGSGC